MCVSDADDTQATEVLRVFLGSQHRLAVVPVDDVAELTSARSQLLALRHQVTEAKLRRSVTDKRLAHAQQLLHDEAEEVQRCAAQEVKYVTAVQGTVMHREREKGERR
jgi:hypothetical protein